MKEFVQQAVSEQRLTADRREFGWRTVMYGFLRSRRHSVRRVADDEVIYLDWHHPWLFFLATGTMLLSVADAFLTLRLIGLGMFEANPVMAGAMGISTEAFAVSKMGMTAFGILTLVFLAKARFLNRMRVGMLLTTLFSAYACLICYEIVSLLKLL